MNDLTSTKQTDATAQRCGAMRREYSAPSRPQRYTVNALRDGQLGPRPSSTVSSAGCSPSFGRGARRALVPRHLSDPRPFFTLS